METSGEEVWQARWLTVPRPTASEVLGVERVRLDRTAQRYTQLFEHHVCDAVAFGVDDVPPQRVVRLRLICV